MVVVKLVLELLIFLLFRLSELLHVVCPVQKLIELLLDGTNCGNLTTQLSREVISSIDELSVRDVPLHVIDTRGQ